MKKELKNASIAANKWFQKNAILKTREDYLKKGKLGDLNTGAVYVYYKDDEAIYIGETSRRVKSRMHDQTSPHSKQKWWKEWNNVRFVNIGNRTDRLTLELLLILNQQPINNTKPGPRNIDDMFDLAH